MLLPELQRLAAELGISGTARMRKGDLVAGPCPHEIVGRPADSKRVVQVGASLALQAQLRDAIVDHERRQAAGSRTRGHRAGNPAR